MHYILFSIQIGKITHTVLQLKWYVISDFLNVNNASKNLMIEE